METERRWFRVREIADYLGLSVKGTYRFCQRHRGLVSKAAGIGIRVDKHALDKWLEAGGKKPGPGRPRKGVVG